MLKGDEKKKIKISLRLALIVPFILLIFGTVSLVGYLSYVSGQKAVENLTHKLMEQAASRIDEHIDNALISQQDIVANSANFVKENLLNINDYEAVKEYLWRQIIISPNLANILFINKDKYLIGYYRLRSREIVSIVNQISGKNYVKLGTLIRGEIDPKKARKHQFYLVDKQGEKTFYLFEISTDKKYWIFDSLNAKKQGWLPVSINEELGVPNLAAVFPFYDSKSQLQAVFLSARLLAGISKFLEDLQISPLGQSFILESSGDLVATSKPENLYIKDYKGEINRLPGIQSQNPWIRVISLELKKKFF